MEFSTEELRQRKQFSMTAPDKNLIDAAPLQQVLKTFAADRNWERFHSPKNLAMALTGEVGELVELFQWLTEEESRHIMQDAEAAMKVRHEVADVLLYLMQIINVLNIDINQAVNEKLRLNAQKYPKGE
jgi:dCTP diphosphatase